MIDKPFRTVLKTEQNHLDKYTFRAKNINVNKTFFNETYIILQYGWKLLLVFRHYRKP